MLHEYGKPLKSLTPIQPKNYIELKWKIGSKLKSSTLGTTHTVYRMNTTDRLIVKLDLVTKNYHKSFN